MTLTNHLAHNISTAKHILKAPDIVAKLLPSRQREQHLPKAVWEATTFLTIANDIMTHSIPVTQVWQQCVQTARGYTSCADIYTQGELRAIDVLAGSITLAPLRLQVAQGSKHVPSHPEYKELIVENARMRTLGEIDYKFKKMHGTDITAAVLRGTISQSGSEVYIWIGDHGKDEKFSLARKILSTYQIQEKVRIF
ncbi:MAG TPA: hypothetical protein VK158_05470 [Acidobacteriota bacterium]|nr:hypothetical protein [Acidobacteriota bacterium]